MNFQYDESTILSYESFGRGAKKLILFHGFGLDKKVFESWGTILGDKYTLVSVDVFYHGESMKPLGFLSKEHWTQIFSAFLQEQEIEKFSVFGFSLGARFAICSAIEFPDRCQHLILSAPDAIYKTPWFKAATSRGLRLIFKYFMLNPRALDNLIRFSVKTRIVSRYMADFVEKELGVAENRRRVYISWNHFKPLGYKKGELRTRFKKAPFEKTLFLGYKDIVIPPDKILPILDGCGFDVTIKPLKHHQMIKNEIAEDIRSMHDV